MKDELGVGKYYAFLHLIRIDYFCESEFLPWETFLRMNAGLTASASIQNMMESFKSAARFLSLSAEKAKAQTKWLIMMLTIIGMLYENLQAIEQPKESHPKIALLFHHGAL